MGRKTHSTNRAGLQQGISILELEVLGPLRVFAPHHSMSLAIGGGMGMGGIRKGGGGDLGPNSLCTYLKWPNQIFPVVNFVFSHYGHFGLGGGGPGGGGNPPPPPVVYAFSNTSLGRGGWRWHQNGLGKGTVTVTVRVKVAVTVQPQSQSQRWPA